MFSYYGGKTNVVRLYPKPLNNKIIEPFCGSARYALQYFEKEVLLVDKFQVVVDVWNFLKQASVKDILSLPDIKQGENLDNFNFDCQEQKQLMGFMIGFASTSPRKTGTYWLTHRPNTIDFTKKRIANNLYKIRHWDIICDSYENITNENATWFIDPPYQFGGHSYVHSNKQIDFENLSEWCKSRMGQSIVCETTGANWLPFSDLTTQKGIKGVVKEKIWTNKNY